MRDLLVRFLCKLSSFIIRVGMALGRFSIRLSVPLLGSEDSLRRALGLAPFSVAVYGSEYWGVYPRQSGRTTKILVGALWEYLQRKEKGTVVFCSSSKHRSERLRQQFNQLAGKIGITPVDRYRSEAYGTGNRTRWELEQEVTRGRQDVLVVWDHEDP